MGSVGCAAVIAYMLYGSPLAVRRPWNFLPYQEASPRSVNGRSSVKGTYSRPSASYGLFGPPRLIGSACGSASGTRARSAGGRASGPSRSVLGAGPGRTTTGGVVPGPDDRGGADPQPVSTATTAIATPQLHRRPRHARTMRRMIRSDAHAATIRRRAGPRI